MAPLKKLSLRLVIYGGVIAYLAGDLFVFHGPLRRRIDLADPSSPEAIARAKADGVVARVFNHRITRGQLERAVRERLWQEGGAPEALPAGLLKTVRYAALDDLIDHELLRVKAKAHGPALKVNDDEVTDRLRRLGTRFESLDAMAAAMKSQGIADEQAMRDRIAARIQQELYVESKVAPLAVVSEDEARDWFERHRDQLAVPERVQVRHMFLPTLDHPSDEAKATLESALAGLRDGSKDFATLAREVSEDPATKDRGGELGWMTRARLPADFSAPVFALETGAPTLLRTRLGWHLVEVTARKPAEPRTFEEARAEVVAALRTLRAQRAVAEYRQALRQFEARHIQVFHEMMAD